MIIQEINDKLLKNKKISLSILRTDLIHPEISGNKFFKLKYNLEEAKYLNYNTLLSFGGAFSNHMYALAAAGKIYHFKTIGIIRGEEHLPLNPSLDFAKKAGMELHYLDRKTYREKHTPKIIQELKEKFGDFYLIPEGGSNVFALKGCSEILKEVKIDFDFITLACGTGGTLAGLLTNLAPSKKILGFPILKNGIFLKEDILKFLKEYEEKFKTKTAQNQFELITGYHFGGYAKQKPELINFIKDFQEKHQIPLDWVYTGKMFYGIFDLIQKDFFPKNTKVLAFHTGGLPNGAVN